MTGLCNILLQRLQSRVAQRKLFASHYWVSGSALLGSPPGIVSSVSGKYLLKGYREMVLHLQLHQFNSMYCSVYKKIIIAFYRLSLLYKKSGNISYFCVLLLFSLQTACLFSFLCLKLWQGHGVGFPPDPFCVLDRWRETKGPQKPEPEVVLHFCCESGGLEERNPFSVHPGELYCTPWRSTQHRKEMGWLDNGHTQTHTHPLQDLLCLPEPETERQGRVWGI